MLEDTQIRPKRLARLEAAGGGVGAPAAKHPQPIPALTGIRFFLALDIVAYHFAHLESASGWVRNLGGSGYVSVSMFFVLSGFMLAYNYLGQTPLDTRGFLVARLARIGPAYWTAMLITVPIWAFKAASSRGQGPSAAGEGVSVLISIGCLQAWAAGSPLIWNFPAWSLSCEWFFYLLFPLAAPRISVASRARLRYVIVTFALISLAIPAVYLFLQPDHIPMGALTQEHLANFTDNEEWLGARRSLFQDGWYRFAIYYPLVHLPIFLLGMALGQYRRLFLAKHSAAGNWWVHFSGAAILGLLCMSGRIPHILLHNSLPALLFAVFIYHVDSLWEPLRRALSLRPLIILGEASYALYILQAPMARWFDGVLQLAFHLPKSDIMPASRFLVFLTLLVAASVVTFLFIERPLGKRIREFAKRSGLRLAICSQEPAMGNYVQP